LQPLTLWLVSIPISRQQPNRVIESLITHIPHPLYPIKGMFNKFSSLYE
jgi:hypothetical protein